MHRLVRLEIYITIYLFVFFEATVMRHFKILGAMPDISIDAVLYFGFFFSQNVGLEAGIVTGLVKDIFALGFPGYNIVIYGLAGFICGLIREKVYRESFLTQCVAAFLAAIFAVKFNLLPAAYSMAVAPLVFLTLETVYRRGQTEEIGL